MAPSLAKASRHASKLLRECNLHTIVRLPKGVFAPYTSIKTNILFFRKGEPTQEIWYFEHPMPSDRKSYSKTRPLSLAEFDLEKKWWHQREENEHAWCISLDEIKKRVYNLDIKNPHQEESTLGNPIKLLAEYQTQLAAAQQTCNQLRGALEAVLHA